MAIVQEEGGGFVLMWDKNKLLRLQQRAKASG
jgi:hypothetical protein